MSHGHLTVVPTWAYTRAMFTSLLAQMAPAHQSSVSLIIAGLVAVLIIAAAISRSVSR